MPYITHGRVDAADSALRVRHVLGRPVGKITAAQHRVEQLGAH